MNDIALYEKVPLLDNSFTVKFMTFDRKKNLLPHWHEHIELLYFIGGECRFNSGGSSFDVRAGDLVIVNGSEIHAFNTDGLVSYYCVLLYPDFFADIEFSNVILKNRVRGDAFVSERFLRMNAEFENYGEGSDMMLKSEAYALMAHLLRGYTEAKLSPKEYDAHRAKFKKINGILEYISENYSKRISTGALAERFFMSEEHLCRIFKRAVGSTVTGYLAEYRAEKASVLLRNTEESIAVIADRVGFDDINYFSRIFKKIKGRTPTEYRGHKL